MAFWPRFFDILYEVRQYFFFYSCEGFQDPGLRQRFLLSGGNGSMSVNVLLY